MTRLLMIASVLCLTSFADEDRAGKKATGLGDARFVACAGNGADFYLDFAGAKLKKDDFGMTTGTLGPVKAGFRKSGGTVEVFTVNYPGLTANGPSTTIQVTRTAGRVRASAKTYDFVAGTGELVADGIGTVKMTCTYYTAPPAFFDEEPENNESSDR